MTRTFQVDTVADGFLELLHSRGVDYFFGAGAGTDFPPIIEAFAKRLALGLDKPRPVTVMHEITAVAMAHGYSMVTGSPQCVMVHTIVGTAHALGGVVNAARARVPLLVAAGRTAITEKGHRASRNLGIHWAQESFDQAGPVREFVKWDYELRVPGQLETVVDRALALTASPPAAPVYLTLPIEVLGESVTPWEPSPKPRLTASGSTVASTDAIRNASHALASARSPVALVSAMGRDREAVAELVRLAEHLGMPVVEHWHTHLNFPQDHPLHLGYDSTTLVSEADVLLVIESDAPWFPRQVEPSKDAVVVQVDDDPLYARYPLRGFPADINLPGSARLNLGAIRAALGGQRLEKRSIDSRCRRWKDEHDRQRKSWRQAAEVARNRVPIDPRWVSRCVGERLSSSDVAITEYVLDPTQTCFREPGTFFEHPHSACLGWATGAALGIQLAKPDATVVCCVGDGAYAFGVPVSTHFMARAYDLPVLFVVYNNAAWNKSRVATFAYAPGGWASKADSVPLCELAPPLDYERICQAAGGYGERVEDPNELPAALDRALRAVRDERRQALLNVICRKD